MSKTSRGEAGIWGHHGWGTGLGDHDIITTLRRIAITDSTNRPRAPLKFALDSDLLREMIGYSAETSTGLKVPSGPQLSEGDADPILLKPAVYTAGTKIPARISRTTNSSGSFCACPGMGG